MVVNATPLILYRIHAFKIPLKCTFQRELAGIDESIYKYTTSGKPMLRRRLQFCMADILVLPDCIPLQAQTQGQAAKTLVGHQDSFDGDNI
jgi:hypothetical protein